MVERLRPYIYKSLLGYNGPYSLSESLLDQSEQTL